jgi:hypothetical protein
VHDRVVTISNDVAVTVVAIYSHKLLQIEDGIVHSEADLSARYQREKD